MGWFEPLPIERDGRLHRWLGTRAFRPFVAGGRFWQRLGLARAGRWRRSNAARNVAESKLVEVAHASSLLILLAVSAWLAWTADWIGVLGIGVLNVVCNGYPILVARYNRHRIETRLAC